MTTIPIYENQDFYAPRFEIKLRGQKVKLWAPLDLANSEEALTDS